MPIISSHILPHGALLLDPPDEVSKHLRDKVKLVCDAVAEEGPDIVLLSSPHAMANSYDFCLFLNETVEGTAEWAGEYTEYSLEWKVDLETTRDMVNMLSVNNAVSGLTASHPSLPMPIRWGEVIPLYFLKESFENPPPLILLSHPTRRHEEGTQMVTELKRLGKNIARYFEKRSERVTLIVSGDLSHTHLEDGPYGLSPSAKLFDQAFQRWVEGSKDDLFKMISLQNEALSCGFTGFIMLEGILDHNPDWVGEVHSISAPSYFGMAVASFS